MAHWTVIEEHTMPDGRTACWEPGCLDPAITGGVCQNWQHGIIFPSDQSHPSERAARDEMNALIRRYQKVTRMDISGPTPRWKVDTRQVAGMVDTRRPVPKGAAVVRSTATNSVHALIWVQKDFVDERSKSG